MATLKEVALLAQVSASTVSRAINYPEKVDVNTLNRIKTAMKKLNYRPNRMASSLRSKTSKQIALIVPNAAHYTSASIIQHASVQLQALGYNLVLGNHNNQLEIETALLNNYFSRNIDGIIMYLVYNDALAVQSLLNSEDRAVPIVIVGRRVNAPSLSNVAVNNYTAGTIASEYFSSLGYKKVATVTGPMVTQWARDRLDGFRAGLSKNNVELSWMYSQETETDFKTGILAAKKFLLDYTCKERPGAIWAQNDIIASGLIKHFSSVGIRIPQDISILGMDNIELATMVSPSISTIRQPFEEIVREAIRIITKKSPTPCTTTIEPTLIIRESTAPIQK